MSYDSAAHDREINARWHAEHVVPCMRDHRASWVVVHRNCNFSAFSGYSYTPSAYSLVLCTDCGRRWRTKAAYVSTLPSRIGQFNVDMAPAAEGPDWEWPGQEQEERS